MLVLHNCYPALLPLLFFHLVEIDNTQTQCWEQKFRTHCATELSVIGGLKFYTMDATELNAMANLPSKSLALFFTTTGGPLFYTEMAVLCKKLDVEYMVCFGEFLSELSLLLSQQRLGGEILDLGPVMSGSSRGTSHRLNAVLVKALDNEALFRLSFDHFKRTVISDRDRLYLKLMNAGPNVWGCPITTLSKMLHFKGHFSASRKDDALAYASDIISKKYATSCIVLGRNDQMRRQEFLTELLLWPSAGAQGKDKRRYAYSGSPQYSPFLSLS